MPSSQGFQCLSCSADKRTATGIAAQGYIMAMQSQDARTDGKRVVIRHGPGRSVRRLTCVEHRGLLLHALATQNGIGAPTHIGEVWRSGCDSLETTSGWPCLLALQIGIEPLISYDDAEHAQR